MNFKTKNPEDVSDLNICPNDPEYRHTCSDREKADVLGHFLKWIYCRARW